MTFTLTLLLAGVLFSCAGKRQPLESYTDSQSTKLHANSAYNQAEFGFWAALYEPTAEDLEGLRSAWIANNQAFPESKAFAQVEREVKKNDQKVALVALFMTSYDLADLNDKSRGWAVSPVPTQITELSENDVVLRALMPVKNQWARYFLLRYRPDTFSDASLFVVSNQNAKVELKRNAAMR